MQVYCEVNEGDFLPVYSLLKYVNMESYYITFEAKGYDTLLSFALLDEHDLDILHIRKPGHRKTLLLLSKDIASILLPNK